MKPNRTIDTNLADTELNREILDSVIGQLSDGMWENSPSMRKYWRFVEIGRRGGQMVILIDDQSFGSGFRGRDDVWVRNFFAGKIKQLAFEEVDSAEWKRTSDLHLSYLSHGKAIVTVSCAYRAYDALRGRKTANKTYTDSPEYIARAKALAAKTLEIQVARQTLARLEAEYRLI